MSRRRHRLARDDKGRIAPKARNGWRECSRCREVKPVEDFPLRTSKGLYRQAQCRACRRVLTREQYHRDKAHAERHEQRLALDRIRHALERRDAGVPESPRLRSYAVGAYEPIAAGSGMVGRKLDAEPLAAWLRFEYRGWAVKELAGRIGVEEATLRRLISGQSRYVSLHVADRILVGADCTHLLALLYPDEDVAA